MNKLIVVTFFFIWTCLPKEKNEKGLEIHTPHKEVCRNGVVYYYDGGYMGYSPKFLPTNPPQLELCNLGKR